MAGLVQTATGGMPASGANMSNLGDFGTWVPDPTKVDPAKALATSKDYYAQQATATPATSQGYSSTDWTVGKDQTVAGNIEGLTDPNSPLNQQAAAQALQTSNKRGLVNSSLAVTAGQDAILKNAMPIAQQDASTRATAAQTNAGAKNTAAQFTANAGNQAALNNSQLGTQVSINNATLGTKAAGDNAAGANNASIANLSADTQKFLGQLTANTNLATTKLSTDTQLALGNLDAATKTALQNIVSKNSQALQVNTSAANVISQGLSSIAAIQTSDKMDAAAKQQAINNILATMQQGIDFSTNVAGMNLPKYFTPVANETPSNPVSTPPGDQVP